MRKKFKVTSKPELLHGRSDKYLEKGFTSTDESAPKKVGKVAFSQIHNVTVYAFRFSDWMYFSIK